MRFQLKRVAVLIFTFYILVTLYSCYRLLQKYVGHDKESRRPTPTAAQSGDVVEARLQLRQSQPDGSRHGDNRAIRNVTGFKTSVQRMVINIWGKAAIGLYLWQHVLNGSLELQPGGMWSYGEISIDDINFRFHTGPGVTPETVPTNITHLVLILNGREQVKVDFSHVWLRSLQHLSQLEHTALMLLGNESCNNTWSRPYMRTHGGPVDLLFLVYDSTDVDESEIFQWPLGVATYRDFPNVPPESLALERVRPFSCNFFGTVYTNSSRETLLQIIKVHRLNCLVKERTKWQAKESPATLKAYTNAMINSDLTLCPVGKNAESYRIYEAMVFGSVPVLEDVVMPGHCDATPYRQLKQLQAPVLYVKDWNELPALLNLEASLSVAEITARRRHVVQWYRDFKETMKHRFVDVIKSSLFDKDR